MSYTHDELDLDREICPYCGSSDEVYISTTTIQRVFEDGTISSGITFSHMYCDKCNEKIRNWCFRMDGTAHIKNERDLDLEGNYV